MDDINLQRMDMVLDPMAVAMRNYVQLQSMKVGPTLPPEIFFRNMAQVGLKAAILAMKRAKAEGRPGA